ncbi:6070_t:CDS:2 [Ambispora gerdemannii]|uniref:6070_t:CDS:1 n=1 Tax=Ambispora gerdemannii TaxID=144530 RepID=A0A9N9BRL6_9GLOM|nr:6070_t:CDS:2 [Ambispora gerdemannii]
MNQQHQQERQYLWQRDPYSNRRQRVPVACSYCQSQKYQRNDDLSRHSSSKRPRTDEFHITIPTYPSERQPPTPSITNWQPFTYIEYAKSETKIPKSVLETCSISPLISETLLKAFLEHVHPYVPVIDSDFIQNESEPLSPLLLYSIFAVSAGFTEYAPERSNYYNKARSLLDRLLDNPRASTIAALILLCVYQQQYFQHQQRAGGDGSQELLIENEEDDEELFRGRMYATIAIGMAKELGLNKECQDPNYTTPQKESRRRLWWSLFMLDVLICSVAGKTSSIDLEDCSVNEPNQEFSEFNQQIKFCKVLQNELISSKRSSFHYEHRTPNIFDLGELTPFVLHLPNPRLNNNNATYEQTNPNNNGNNETPNQLHFTMLCHTLTIILHERNIDSSFEKCTLAANCITDLADQLVHKYGALFKGFFNCTNWCLFEAGKIQAKNVIRSSNETSNNSANNNSGSNNDNSNENNAEIYYTKTIALFKELLRFKKSALLEQYATNLRTNGSISLTFSNYSTTTNSYLNSPSSPSIPIDMNFNPLYDDVLGKDNENTIDVNLFDSSPYSPNSSPGEWHSPTFSHDSVSTTPNSATLYNTTPYSTTLTSSSTAITFPFSHNHNVAFHPYNTTTGHEQQNDEATCGGVYTSSAFSSYSSGLEICL